MTLSFDIIAAIDSKRGLGKNGDLAWRLPEEMKYFQQITTETKDSHKKNAVVMGRTTWESIPEKHRPLKDRVNVVLTRQVNYEVPEEVLSFSSQKNAFKSLKTLESIENIFIIGGALVYEDALLNPENLKYCKRIYLTEIHQDFGCDVFFPNLPESFQEIKRDPRLENGVSYDLVIYEA